MYSIYHFFKDIVEKKKDLISCKNLEKNFPYNQYLLSCRSASKFPDLAIKVNPVDQRENFTGGELIEIKDSKSYQITSFNSTIPTGKKAINDLVSGKTNKIRSQMKEKGDDIESLPERDVFYLVRGQKTTEIKTKERTTKKTKIKPQLITYTKVCLIHGSFFETLNVNDLIQQAFGEVFNEIIDPNNQQFSDETKKTIISLFSEQKSFSKVRDVEKSSVKIRFRIMTEAKAEGNILNSKKYPEIKDNTLNFLLPCHDLNSQENLINKMKLVFGEKNMNKLKIFQIKHHLNGNFLCFQTSL